MNNIQISTRHAVSRLNDTNLIRVLTETDDLKGGLAVRFLPREEVKKIISENTCEITGPEAIKRGFGFSLESEGKVVFVESRSK